jgi:hypothetical protein
MKRTWFIALPLLCAAVVAQADGMPSASAAAGAEPAATQAKAPTSKIHQARLKRLPRGDLRHCLDLTANEEIIRCAETRRKR